MVSNAGIFIHDGVFDAAIGADTYARLAGLFMLDDRLEGFVIVAAKKDRAVDDRARADDAAQSGDAMGNDGMIDDAAVRDNGMVDLRAIDFGSRQKARPAEDGSGHVEKIEARQFAGDIQVGFKERSNRADIFPIALDDIG